MVTSVGLSNVVWVLMLANWLLEGRWKEKWRMAHESALLQAFAVLLLVHLVGMLWSDATGLGLHIVERMLPVLAVPLVVLTSKPPEGKTRSLILAVYIFTVVAVTIIGLVRVLTIPGLPHREIVTYISHIRFSLNCCMVIYLLMDNGLWSGGGSRSVSRCLADRFSIFHYPFSIPRFLLLLWMLTFLLLLRSYTAFAVLAVASLVAILRYRRRWQWVAAWVTVAGVLTFMVIQGCRSYYQLGPLASQPLQECTANGRPYLHKQDGLVENGNYVNNYLCPEELRSAWPRRSHAPIDSITASGYSVESALIRYLNALGLTKDSVGVAALTDTQVDEIASGVANPVYLHGSQLRKMLYVILFEYENYRCYHAVLGFTMLQRLELWRCAWRVIGKHPWFGTGTGDLHDDMHTEFVAMDSPMLQHEVFPHNEYLTLLSMFGIVGFAVTLIFFLRAWLRRTKPLPPLMLLWLVTILISCLTENTIDSLAGILFCTWFLAFRQTSD
jgi:hypothetical protein